MNTPKNALNLALGKKFKPNLVPVNFIKILSRPSHQIYKMPQKEIVAYAWLNPVSILRKSISGRRPVRVADGPMTARCRFT